MKVQALTTKAAVIIALVLGSSQWLQAQSTNGYGTAGGSEHSWGSDRSATERSSTQQSSTGQPMNYNKASSLIGMSVVNPQGEKLGKVKDVVIDLNGDRVSYVVLSTGTSILSSEKLHAVPLQAFRPDSAGNELILNADKNKIEQAQGFDKNSWPSLNSTSWGAEPFWKAPTGTSGSSSGHSGSSSSQPDSSSGERDSSSGAGETGR